MSVCPSDFAIDDSEIHAGSRDKRDKRDNADNADNAETERHLQGCVACQKRRLERAAARSFFDDSMAGPTWSRIVAERASRTPRRRLRAMGWRWALLMGMGAASVVVVIVVAVVAVMTAADRRPPVSGSYVAVKGRAAAEIFCHRGDRASIVAPGDVVAPGDLLRFRPLPLWPEARFIQIGSVDGTGSYTSFYPARDDADSVALPARGVPLEGSIRLDDAPGPERVFVVVSVTPVSARDVRRVAEANAQRQLSVDIIGDTPVRSAWIVLAKTHASTGTGTGTGTGTVH